MPDSPLLTLPRELRDIIYHYAMLDTSICFYDRYMKVRAYYGDVYGPRSQPRWMFACRQIRDEAAAQFYLYARLHSYVEEFQLYNDNSIFSLARFRVLEFKVYFEVKTSYIEDVEHRGTADVNMKRRVLIKLGRSYPGCDLNFRLLRSTLLGRQSIALQKLVLDFRFDLPTISNMSGLFPNPDNVSMWVNDLAALEGFAPNGHILEALEIKFGAVSMPQDMEQQLRAHMIVVPALKWELVRLAKTLLGGVSRGWSITDRMEGGRLVPEDWQLNASAQAEGLQIQDLRHMTFNIWACPNHQIFKRIEDKGGRARWICVDDGRELSCPL